MCTAATYSTKCFYFGRTLDYECSYGEEVVVTPRAFPFSFLHAQALPRHYAIIGMAHVSEGRPLYYDAANEKGLCMAGLNFVDNAVYASAPVPGKDNIAQFEFIPWVLGQCASLDQARALLERLNLTGDAASPHLPPAQLHWMIADREGCIVVESMADGLHIWEDPAGVLTNNPPFDAQLFSLNNYLSLSPKSPQNTFAPQIPLLRYSRGMGALGLPGDLSSQSRFIRAAFVRAHSLSGESEAQSVSQFFHILGSVDQQRGCCELEEGVHEITIYTSCCNADTGVYYYTTYERSAPAAVDMHRCDLDGADLFRYPMLTEMQVTMQN